MTRFSSRDAATASAGPRIDDATHDRADVLARAHVATVAVRTDRLFALLLPFQWLAAITFALTLSPREWSGGESRVHVHVWTAIFLGAAIALPTAAVAYARAGATFTRHLVAAAQMLMGALIIHVTGGRIESHFHIFGSLAFLAFYRDWRVLATASAVVLVDHVLLGALVPLSVFGVANASVWRSVEHAAWVFFEDVFLIASCVQGRREMRTIAERRAQLELNVDLEASLRAAEQANLVKSEFLANMSHEIRTPMTAIQGYADLLVDPHLDASERLSHTQTIRRNSQHLLSIIDDVLDLSKIEAGRLTLESIACSPAQIVADVASLMRIRATEKRIAFDVVFATEVPVAIQSDPTRVRQILVNLVGNAIKFTERGAVRIIVSCVGVTTLEPRMTFEVNDTGVGLTDPQIARLFQPFSQADSSTTRKYGGSGLGLAICRRLATALGGDVRVSSRPAVGSSFTLEIKTGPLFGVKTVTKLREAGEDHVVEMPARATKLACRVLLAEDGPDNQALISAYLKKAGAEVVVADNGRIAVERALAAAADGTPFDIILMDMQMPELDGYGATSKLRSLGYLGPVVALTAHAMSGDRERCLAAGCDGYLTKPIDRAKLLMTVESFVARKGAPARPSRRVSVAPAA